MFRSFLDKVPVDEIDLMWALETVKCLQLKEHTTKKKRQKKIRHVDRNDDSVFLDEESFSLDDEEEEEKSKGFLHKIFRKLRRTKFSSENNSSEESELPSEPSEV